jgi:hypothetical protein
VLDRDDVVEAFLGTSAVVRQRSGPATPAAGVVPR